jgi:protein SCO1/2
VSPRLVLASGIALCLFGTAVAVAVALSGKPASDADSPAAIGPASKFAGPLMPRNLRAADFALTDQDRRTVRLSDTRGRVAVLTFLHSQCGSTCPVTVQTIRGALDDLEPAERRDVAAFAISVAPEEDTLRRVRRFVSVQHAGGFLRYLTGSRDRLAKVWKGYGIRPQGPKGEDHSAFVLLVDREGLLRVGFPAHGVTPEDLAHDLRVLLDEAA